MSLIRPTHHVQITINLFQETFKRILTSFQQTKLWWELSSASSRASNAYVQILAARFYLYHLSISDLLLHSSRGKSIAIMKLCYLIIVAVGIPAAISSRQRVVHTPIIKATKRSTYANASIDLSLEDSQVIEELVWSINMTVGVPRQNFTAVLDTSTSDLFIPDLKSNLCLSSNQSTCNINSVACDPAEICNGSEVIPSSYFGGFDPSSSSTLTLLNHLSGFHATYNGGDSQVNGTFALDDISIHGLNVEQAEFVVAEEASGVLPVRATWGIGFENYQADHNAIEIYPSILRKMKDQAIISCMLFSLYPNSYGKL